MQREREEDKDSSNFRLIQVDSPQRISAAALHNNFRHIDHHDDGDDFDFSFIGISEARPPIAAAADIFSDGKIRPVYPVFNRDLLLNLNLDDEPQKKEAAEEKESKSIRMPLRRLFIEEEREQASFSSTSSSASSSLDELDGIAPGTYCVWTPPNKNDHCKKSSSTGSSPSLRWRLRDLVVGRSQSDGKEKFVFIPMQEEKPKKLEKNNTGSSSNKGKKLSRKSTTTEVDVVTAQQRMKRTTHYGQQVGRGAGRKSFLPYRQDLVGFFASVNGLSRSHYPLPEI